jgi:uncharacterized membrane protein
MRIMFYRWQIRDWGLCQWHVRIYFLCYYYYKEAPSVNFGLVHQYICCSFGKTVTYLSNMIIVAKTIGVLTKIVTMNILWWLIHKHFGFCAPKALFGCICIHLNPRVLEWNGMEFRLIPLQSTSTHGDWDEYMCIRTRPKDMDAYTCIVGGSWYEILTS